jgi:predicted small secreted protein
MLDGEIIPNVPLDSIVYKTGNQEIYGIKTFRNNIFAPNIVYTTNTNQTINGSKTFTSAISAPNLVYTNNDQQISGIKTFAQRPTVNGSGVVLEGELFPNISFTDLVLRSGDQTISGIKSFIDELNAPNIVHNTGNENILGIKNFINRPTVNGSGIILENELFPNINYEELVLTTGNKTISGVKTFSDAIIFSTGITASNLVYNTGSQSIAGIKRFTAKTIHTAELVAPNIVYNTGDQIISGIKDFQSRPTVSGIGVILSGEIYPDVQADKIAFITGNQTISGIKVFQDGIYAPNIVYNTGNQTISGIKVFDERPTLSGSGFLLQGEIFPDINFNELVLTSGNQTISGIKTFSDGIASFNLVYNTGNQTINGVKNFSNGILSTNIVYSSGTNQNILGTKTFNARTIFLNGITAGNIVYNTGNQNIDGIKNFLYRPTVNGSGVVLEGELFPNVNPNQIVYTTGNQTISGIKNFSGELYAPNIIYKTGDHNLSGTISFSKRPNVNGTGILIAGDIYPELNLNNIVYTTGDQVVNGFKYFTIRPEVKIDENNESRVALVSEVISLTGENQNVTGIKNFLNRPTVNNSAILISGEDLKYRPTVNGSGVLLFGEGVPSPIQIKYENNILGNAAALNFSGQEFNVSIVPSIEGGIATIQITGIQNTVRTTGNQTIAGLKTFSNGIVSNVGVTGTNLVYNTGNQTIAGLKTFSNGIVSNVGVTGTNLVYNTGNQTIAGLKTFSNGIVSTIGITGTNLVYNTGNQTINGVKNFISKPTVNNNEIFVYGDYLIDIKDEGTSLGNANAINFTGPGVSTSLNNGTASIFIDGGIGGGGNYVSLVGDETIAGIKTFTDGIVSSNVVYTTTTQTINGFKTFGARTTFSNGLISNAGITGQNIVYNTGDQIISGLKIFTNGINLSGAALENAVPKTIDVNSNFDIISGIYNTKIIFADSSSPITGTISGNNPTGFNTTIVQYGTGPIRITGAPGITINSYQNRYESAGPYAAISIIQKSDNNYVIFGNTV